MIFVWAPKSAKIWGGGTIALLAPRALRLVKGSGPAWLGVQIIIFVLWEYAVISWNAQEIVFLIASLADS